MQGVTKEILTFALDTNRRISSLVKCSGEYLSCIPPALPGSFSSDSVELGLADFSRLKSNSFQSSVYNFTHTPQILLYAERLRTLAKEK